jgi:hypothetical protein
MPFIAPIPAVLREPLLLALLACIGLLASSGSMAADAPPATTAQPKEHLTLDVKAAKPWKGDLDGMIARGVIRVLVVPSKTFYFMDKGVQRGATYEFVRQFEDDLNKKLTP